MSKEENKNNKETTQKPQVFKPWYLLKNSSGDHSVSYTMVVVAFFLVTLWLVLSIVESVGSVKIRAFSATEAMGYLSPILMLYFSRRYTEAVQLKNKVSDALGSTGSSVPPPASTTEELKENNE